MERFPKKKLPEISVSPETTSTFIKWIPFICAGAALGVGIVALKEIKNIQSDFVTIKNENNLKQLENQVLYITNYINEKKNKKKHHSVPVVERAPSPIKENVNETEQEINIINEDEYEEVEVTDDES